MSGDEKASKNSSPSLSQSVMPSQPSNRSSCRESRQNVEGVHVIEGLKLGCTNMENPQRHEGFLLKKRKWPLKGWHKRFFILENGILKYAKSPIEVQRGKLHGCIDVGLSVMSIKKHSQCIDLDTEEYIYHLKIKSPEAFDSWVCKLRDHRLFRQNEIAHSPGDTSRTLLSPLESSPAVHFADEKLSCSSSSAGLSGALSNGQSKLSGWLFHSDEMEQCAQDLSEGQEGLVQLNAIIKSLEILQRTQSVPSFSDMQGSCLENCKKEKRSSKRWRTKSVSKDSKMHLQLPMSPVCSPVRLHASNPNLSLETTHNQEPVMGNCGGQAGFWVGGLWSGGRKSLGSWGSETGTGPCLVVPSLPVSHTQSSLGESLQEYVGDSARLQMEYCQLAQKVHFLLRTVFNMVAIEKDKLKQVVSEQEALNSGHAAQINNLKKTLAQALHQNTELRNRLNRIHSESSLTETMASLNGLSPDVARDSFGVTDHVMNHQTSNDSKLSMSESMSEFFDAQEVLLSASSSDNEASDESCGSDVSDNASEDTMSLSSGTGCTVVGLMPLQNGRRRFLPAPAPDTSSISLWHLLRHNIGKDLAKVALPVELNEPLNTLQRLCEELEYSELLEAAAETDDPTQRMVLVAAFAVSGYAATYYRAGNKPFNPVLGETYECVREDRGFRFIAEQVSHHPPISACHCDSKNFVFWQDVRWKNKFWGKSMEILPVGTIHLTLPK
uniref:Oxysterol-binding protein n=1 Tax=Eptatretus burgeri TaxID=7764 RepID=A0A8C4NG72_EPTBU